MADEQNTDVIQGTLDMLILKTLSLEPMHGFGIARRVEQISRGVFRWSRTDRATDDGELKKPETMTRRIATPIWVESPYNTPETPMPIIAMTIHAGSA